MKKPLKLKSDCSPVLSPDGRLVLTMSLQATLIDVDTGKPIWKAKPMPYLSDAAFDVTGSRIAIKAESGEIAVLDAETGDVQFKVGKPDDDDEGSNLAFSPCGKFIVDGSWSGKLNIRSAADGKMNMQHTFATQMIQTVIPFGDYLFVHHCEKYVKGMDDRMDYIGRWPWPMTDNKCDIFPFRPQGLQGFTPVAEDRVLVSNIQPGDRYRLTLADVNGEVHNWSTEQ